MRICNKEKCTACGACLCICSKGAIAMVKDDLKKTYAVIDADACVNCGVCKKICPSNNTPELRMAKECYAIWSKNTEYARNCASGGLATGFAEAVMKDNGVVFGTRFSNGEFIFDSTDKVEFSKFKGSKYVQVNTGDIYKTIKSALQSGKKTLFVGTPCQVSGLKAYLQKDYNNLITVDIICHGTPPFEYLKEYMNSITKELVTNVTFRGKKDFFLTLYSEEREIYSKFSGEDIYYAAFLQGVTYRDNCYSCIYARPERVGDLTIGDFWGLDKNTMKNKYDGRISVLLVNNSKGTQFFDKIKDGFIYEKRELEEAFKSNGQLTHPTKRHQDRDEFEANYRKYGFVKAAKTKSIKKQIRKYKLVRTLPYRAINKMRRIVKGE